MKFGSLPSLFAGLPERQLALVLCFALFSASAAAETPYGLDARESVEPYVNGTFPPVLPGAVEGLTTVEAFPHLKFQNPVFLTFAPKTGRLYVCEREGTIQSFVNDPGSRVKSMFLDVRNRCQGWDDCGLLGLAFHPDFGVPGSPNRGFCYVYYQYSESPVPGPDRPPDWRAGRNRLSRFTVPDGSIVADPNSELVLIDQNDEHVWHNGGGIFFHPGDGYLYLSLGDEGGSSDNFENTNRIDKDLFSGVIRIDVDKNPARSHPPPRKPLSGTTANYWIPNDNPFVGVANALEEFYCIGLRSPHRMTLDPVTGRIWSGDVGQRAREELNLIERGANYQWTWKEGSLPVEGRTRPAQVIGAERGPVYEYPHADGNNCIISGYVYRGNSLSAELWGKHIFGDNTSGRLWSLSYDGNSAPVVKELTVLAAAYRAYTGLSSFGIDENGEIYLCILGNNQNADGHIRKLAPAGGTSNQAVPPLLSRAGLFSQINTLTPATGLISYDVNSPLWSDGASKSRWIAVPGSTAPFDPVSQQIAFSPKGEWKFPAGTVFVKHFELPVDESAPQIVKRLETRVLVREPSGSVYGVVYKWRGDNTDAELLSSSATEELSIKTAAPFGPVAGQDVGAAISRGSTTAAGGGFDLTSGGADIGARADQFHFAHQRRSGNFDVRVRVESFTAPDSGAKAGIMVRETLAAGSRHLFALAFPANGNAPTSAGFRLEYRTATDGDSSAIYPDATFQVKYPNSWLRLRRVGNTFTAFAGYDGVSWRAIGTVTMSLPSDVELGLALCAHSSLETASAKFRDLANNRSQTWYYPSRADCLTCHNSTANYVLGVNTRQLNRLHLYSTTGRSDNQLRTLSHIGLFNQALDESAIPAMDRMVNVSDTNALVETRVRSYLDSNCSHCHRPNGVRTTMDLRFDIPLSNQNILNGSVSESLGIPNARIVAPRDIPASMLHHRMNTFEQFKMPPVGSNILDQAALAAVREFIMKMPLVEFHSAVSYADELSGQAIIPVTLNAAVSNPVTVNYSVSGTATGGIDYEVLSGTLTFQPGETTTNIAVTLTKDNATEIPETLVLTLENATNASLGATATHTLTIADQSQPYVVSPITASLNPAAVGDWVQFTAHIGSSLPLTYTWSFGDGTTAVGGSTTTHTYAASGNYVVSVTATTPSGESVTDEIYILVQNARPPGGVRLPMSIRKLLGSARFNTENRDSCTVAGILVDAEVNSFSSLDFSINAGGASTMLQLNSKGKGKNSCCKAQLKRVRKSRNLVFIATLKGSFAQHWSDEGINGASSVKNSPISMDVEVTLGASVYAVNAAALYSSKAAQQGRFRLKF